MTKYQRHKHKQLVDELKHRKSNGKNNLVIRNGEIIIKRSHTNNARNNDTRATQMETAPPHSDINADPSTITPAVTRMDNAPSQSSTVVDGPANSS